MFRYSASGRSAVAIDERTETKATINYEEDGDYIVLESIRRPFSWPELQDLITEEQYDA